MKKLIVFTILFFSFTNLVMAQPNSSEAVWSLARKTGGCGLGIAAGVMTHELGHQIIADNVGAHMKWNGTDWHTNASRSHLRWISMAGLTSQMLSSEIILRTEAIPKDNSFTLCWLGFNVVNQIAYSLQNELSSGGYKDLATYSRNGGNVRSLETILILQAIWTGYRIYNNPNVPVFFNITKKEVRVGFNIKF